MAGLWSTGISIEASRAQTKPSWTFVTNPDPTLLQSIRTASSGPAIQRRRQRPADIVKHRSRYIMKECYRTKAGRNYPRNITTEWCLNRLARHSDYLNYNNN